MMPTLTMTHAVHSTQRAANDAIELAEISAASDSTKKTAEGEDMEATVAHIPTETSETIVPTELTDQTNYLPKKQVIIVFLGLSLSLLLSQLDQTIVAVALPKIASDLRSDIYLSSWVGSAFLMTGTAFNPVWSRCSDIFGRKACLLTALVTFWLGSLACALAKTMLQLIIFRGIAGAGGGAIVLMTMIITADIVPRKDNELYQSITSTTMLAANAVGPLLGNGFYYPFISLLRVSRKGGIIAQHTSWRVAFWINVPIGAISILAIIFFLPLKPVDGSIRSKLTRLDYLGLALFLAGSSLVIYALTVGGFEFAWSSAKPLATLLTGVTVGVIFCLYEWKVPAYPILPMHLFKLANASILFGLWFAVGFVFYATLYFVPAFYQIVKGYSPTKASLMLLPLIAGQFGIQVLSGMLVRKTGKWKLQLCISGILYSVGLGLFSLVHTTTGIAKPLLFLSICGVGSGTLVGVSHVALLSSIHKRDMAVAIGTRNFLRWLGGTLGIAGSVAIVDSRVIRAFGTLTRDQLATVQSNPAILHNISALGSEFSVEDVHRLILAYQEGYQLLWQVCAGLLGAATVASFVLHPVSANEEDVEEQREKSRAWLEQRKAENRAKSASKRSAAR